MAFRKDAAALLPKIGVPTLVIAGQKDMITPPEGMKKMADQIANADYHVIPEAAHLTPVEQPEAFNRLLLDFVKPFR
ncbi:putative non-heme bromoperoxidase BpoC [compost metagenome]